MALEGMTDEALEALREEYRAEYAQVEAWLTGGQYDGTWLPELRGRAFSSLAPDAQKRVCDLLSPGILFMLFETRVLGQHEQYPDYMTVDDQGNEVAYSQLLPVRLQALREELASLLG